MRQSTIILEEIKKQKMSRELQDAISDILGFERDNFDQKQPRFKEKYRLVIERLAMEVVQK